MCFKTSKKTISFFPLYNSSFGLKVNRARSSATSLPYFYKTVYVLYIVDQYCTNPPPISNATRTIYTCDGVIKEDLIDANLQHHLMYQSYVIYKCDFGTVHYNGTLDGACVCSNHSEDTMCREKPEWSFEQGLPTCHGILFNLVA